MNVHFFTKLFRCESFQYKFTQSSYSQTFNFVLNGKSGRVDADCVFLKIVKVKIVLVSANYKKEEHLLHNFLWI